jgi:hypothetical protein
MTKEEAIAVMLESINSDNRTMGLQAGVDAEEIEKQIVASQPSLAFMLSNMYDKLKDGGAIA